MSKHTQSNLVQVEGTDCYLGWDPILGTRFNYILFPWTPPSFYHKKVYGGKHHNQRQSTHFNVKKGMTFTRSIGYA